MVEPCRDRNKVLVPGRPSLAARGDAGYRKRHVSALGLHVLTRPIQPLQYHYVCEREVNGMQFMLHMTLYDSDVQESHQRLSTYSAFNFPLSFL